ncbi:hypothetical protein HMPREF9625_01233 [Oribacterium parvum ACB1]|uniref:Uncharacterized protein n=1 Tax=Oribacterium parvum ACB1 TaxID=796943 RepID=G9WPF0_9FIRM|nr:hypothetical protein HMPREF9625_01233 [Oribacterium parvum ACB1]
MTGPAITAELSQQEDNEAIPYSQRFAKKKGAL